MSAAPSSTESLPAELGRGQAVHPRWVVFSTFDHAGRASSSAVEQVRAHRDAGFDVLVVDTSDTLTESRRADWEQEATRWFQRPNIGYDFGSYKAGLANLMTHEGVHAGAGDIVFANDSCFGPFAPLKPVIEGFDRMPQNTQRVFGITDSVQLGHHLQSYWIYFRADVLHLAIEFLLHQMAEATNRDEAIGLGEIAFGEFLRSKGCVLEAACPVYKTLNRLACFNGWPASTLELGLRYALKRWKYGHELDKQCLRQLLRYPDRMEHFNPVDLFGIQLHRSGASPFVKKSMLRNNVYGHPDIPPDLDPGSMTNADVRALLR